MFLLNDVKLQKQNSVLKWNKRGGWDAQLKKQPDEMWRSFRLQAYFFVSVELAGDWKRNEGGGRGALKGGSYFWPAAGASEKEEQEEEGGEWALGGPVEGVRGGEGLLPTVPDRAICCLSWAIVRSSFSLASRSLRSSSCSSCRSASACSSLWRSSDNWEDTEWEIDMRSTCAYSKLKDIWCDTLTQQESVIIKRFCDDQAQYKTPFRFSEIFFFFVFLAQLILK